MFQKVKVVPPDLFDRLHKVVTFMTWLYVEFLVHRVVCRGLTGRQL